MRSHVRYLQFVPASVPLLALAWLLSGGCAAGGGGGARGEDSTRVVQASERQAAAGHPPIRKVLVQAMLSRDDLKRQMEDEFARQLKARGVDVVPCYTVGKAADQGPVSREDLKRHAASVGADAVIIAGLVRVDREAVTEPGEQVGGRGEYRPGYPALSYQSYEQPPTTVEERTAILETKVFDAKTADPLLTARTDTTIMTDPSREIPGFVRVIIERMEKAHLLPSS